MTATGDTLHLHCDALACMRGGRLLFRGLNMAVSGGQAIHITGANGTGKSSLLRMFAGLLSPFSGTLVIHRRAALLNDTHALDAERTVEDALGFWAVLYGHGRKAQAATATALAKAEMGALAKVPVRFLSTGQQQRASLARLLLADAAVWLLDEPGNGLDDAGIAMLTRLVSDHVGEGGSVIYTSHFGLPIDGARVFDLTPHAVSAASEEMA